jgi:hypothetical protein
MEPNMYFPWVKWSQVQKLWFCCGLTENGKTQSEAVKRIFTNVQVSSSQSPAGRIPG